METSPLVGFGVTNGDPGRCSTAGFFKLAYDLTQLLDTRPGSQRLNLESLGISQHKVNCLSSD
jgi:hypothetical protein